MPETLIRRRFLKTILLGFSASLGPGFMTGCGFAMRGQDLGLSFQRIALEGDQAVAKEVRRLLASQKDLQITTKRDDAQVALDIVSQRFDRSVIAFSSAGRPREIQLRYQVTYRITDQYGVELVPPQIIAQTRDISVSESEVLAMTSAEDFMRNDMNRDIAQQLIRRLRAVKLPAP